MQCPIGFMIWSVRSRFKTVKCDWVDVVTMDDQAKKKLYVSKLLCAFVFRYAFDSAKFQAFNYFCLLKSFFFFFSFLWTCLSKYRWKDMTDTIKHFEQQTSSTLFSVLYLVHPKIILNKVVADSNLKRLLLRGEKMHLGQVFQSVTSFETYKFFSLASWKT